jgi:hypothetical protein
MRTGKPLGRLGPATQPGPAEAAEHDSANPSAGDRHGPELRDKRFQTVDVLDFRDMSSGRWTTLNYDQMLADPAAAALFAVDQFDEVMQDLDAANTLLGAMLEEEQKAEGWGSGRAIPTPPRWAILLLFFVVPADRHADRLGDFEEKYWRLWVSRSNRRWASAIFGWQIVRDCVVMVAGKIIAALLEKLAR